MTLLLLFVSLAFAETPPLTLIAEAPPPPAAPEHESVNPCAQARLDDDLLGKKKASCKGITRVHFDPKLEAVSWAVSGAKMWVSEVKVQLSLQMEMSVTKNFEEGSCPYKATVAHETGHWNDALDLQKKAVAGFKADLAKAGLPTASAPAAAKDADKQAFADAKTAVVTKIFEKRRDEFLAALRAANAKRDSPYRYRMVDLAKCPRDQWLNDAP